MALDLDLITHFPFLDWDLQLGPALPRITPDSGPGWV